MKQVAGAKPGTAQATARVTVPTSPGQGPDDAGHAGLAGRSSAPRRRDPAPVTTEWAKSIRQDHEDG